MPFWVKYLINTYKILNESEVTNNTDFRNNTLICGDCLNVMNQKVASIADMKTMKTIFY